MRNATLILRPALATMISVAVIATPFLLLGASAAVEIARTGDPDILALVGCTGIFLFGLWLLLEVATVRICLTRDRLLLQRFWRTRWSVRRKSAILTPGRAGDGAILSGLRVYETGRTGRVGEILNAQFRTVDLERLQRALADDQL
jgi:hypothetical protein